METEQIRLTDLALDPSNARKHSEKNLEAIKGSLKRFGQQKPVVVDANGVIVAGNGTVEAAKALGWAEIAVVRSELKGSDRTAFALADNRTTDLSEWDDDVLGAQLQALYEEGYEIDDIGFDPDEYDWTKDAERDEKEDDVPETAENEFGVERGQIWQLGAHRILCGDSTCKEDVDRLMGGEKADMVFTDPPYGMNLDTDYSKMAGKGNKYRPVEGDDRPFNPSQILGLQLPTVLFGADYYWKHLDGGQISVWDKRTHKDDETNQLGKVWGSHFEVIWSNVKAAKVLFRHLWCAGLRAGKSEERSVDGSKPVFLHPTQKPIDLCVSVIAHYGDPKSVLDLFLGSGSTLIACEKTKRKCYGMEIDPHYCSVIIKRWQEYSGQEACKVVLT